VLETAAPPGVSAVLDVVTASPGLTRAAAARALRCRRAVALELVAAAVAGDVVHEAESAVPIRAGATRTVTGLYPGPAARALFAEPALSGERLRQTRQRAGVSVGALAGHLDVSPAQLRRWETGQQSVPARVRVRVPGAIEAGQKAAAAQLEHAATRPRRRRDARRYRELLERIAEQPGRSRYALVGTRTVDARLLEHALATGQAHEAPSWTERSRQPVVGVFPGPAPAAVALPRVVVADLVQARRDAGWSQDRIAQRLGLVRTTWARWERELELVPGWAAATAATVLEEARTAAAARTDRRTALVAAVVARPGLSRKALLSALGYTRWSGLSADALAAAVAAGEVHERHAGRHGQQSGLFPGPAPADVLTPARLRALRTRAGLTQRALAVTAGTHVQAVRDWESARRPIPHEWQTRLLERLEAQPDAVGTLCVEMASALPATRHQLDKLFSDRTPSERTAALKRLMAEGRAHAGRVGAGREGRAGRITLGRAGYLPGPA